MLEVRKTAIEDLNEVEKIFIHARKQMAINGNPTQWGDDRPSMELVKKDIAEGNSYVILNDGKITATFAYIIGTEPTYLEIDGAWLNDEPYGTIHRIASLNEVKGIFDCVIEYVSGYGADIRIDTHRDNKTMLHLIEKNGFFRCGIIIVDDGTERIAFQKRVN
ncbi:MAG: GNAT family N-acetyltransferase [Erysipelotrichaceae bacterium]|nr:GNAT family N-acetyltransferase [Erysipelotrichaceae bacterium]